MLLTKSAEAFFVVKVLGAIYLSWIGIKALMSAFSNTDANLTNEPSSTGQTLSKSFFEGFLTNALNPKVSMFYLAAFPQFIPANENAILYAFLLVSIHSVMNFVWFSSMVFFFSRLTSMVKGGLFQRILKGITGVVFISFGIKLFTLESK
ncbi:MAG: LysE family translocator [Paraglaciecola sp.]|nr:LysE family translocator [Paraglaciecola sp.]